jgi:hypothetical protein
MFASIRTGTDWNCSTFATGCAMKLFSFSRCPGMCVAFILQDIRMGMPLPYYGKAVRIFESDGLSIGYFT